MTTPRYPRLEDVVLDVLFPDVDLALRRGRHVTADELAFYTFLSDAREHLETLYRRYGCELMHKSDGFFYLLPTGDKLGKRHLRPVEMLVGQALALLYLDPRTVEAGGTIVRDDVLGQLASVLGSDDLVRALYPGKKRVDERVAQEGVRAKVSDAIRKLGSLGFVSTTDEGRIKLSPALLRFAEPARLGEPPDVILARLAAEGELVITEGLDDDGSDEDDEDGESDEESTSDSGPPPPAAADAPRDPNEVGDPEPVAPAATAPTDDAATDAIDAHVPDAKPAPEATPMPEPKPAVSDLSPPAAAVEARTEVAADATLAEDDEPPFESAASFDESSLGRDFQGSDDDEPYVPAGPALDDGLYELEGPFGDEAADDEIPYEIDPSDPGMTPAEIPAPAPRERDDAPPSSRG